MGSCKVIVGVIETCAVVSVSATSFLFLLRVRAVYMSSRVVTIIFGALWLASVALNVTGNVSLQIGQCHSHFNSCVITIKLPFIIIVQEPGTGYCIPISAKDYFFPSIAAVVNDTCVFAAISYRLSADAGRKRSWRSGVLSAFSGKGLHRLSRSLMESGQIYYL